jgi:tetratricopeptide (TPR) repeat protein
MLVVMRRAFILISIAASVASAQQPSPEQLFTRAVAAQQRGDYATAISDYQMVLKLEPKMAEARVNLGAALAHSGRLDDAIGQYKLALSDAQEKDAVRMDLGLAYYKKGDLADASREFAELRRRKPGDVQLAILLGDVDVKQSKGAEAVAMMAPLEAENAGNADFEYVLGTALLQAGQRRQGADRLHKLAQTTQSADTYLLAGSTYLDLNNLERARADLDAALRLDSKLPHIYTLAGIARDKSGDAAAAEPAFREALRLDPDDFDANLYLGAILYKRRQVQEAKPYLDRALALNPTSAMARYEGAMLKSTSGQYEAAAKDLEAVIQQDPSWLEPHVELATVYYRLHRPADGAKERQIVDRITAEQQSKGPGKQ